MAKIKGDAEIDVVKLRNFTSVPTVGEGSIYYNATDNKYYGSIDGVSWTEIGAVGAGANFATNTFTAQTSVVFSHNLGTKPLIQVLNSSDEFILPDTITHDTDNQTTVTFLTSETGTILAVGGTVTGDAVTYETLDTAGDVGDAAGQLAIGNHTHDQFKTMGVKNLGLDLTAGRLKIVSADGSVLSATNKGYVTMPSTTPGQSVTLEVTADTHFFDDASHTSGGDFNSDSEYGTTAGVAWGNIRPFMLYAINTDDTSSGLYFGFSPSPVHTVSSGLASNWGYQGVPATAKHDRVMTVMTATDTTAFGSVPVMRIGTLRGTKDASDDWTFNAITNSNGMGVFKPFQGEVFTFPQGQMGNESGTFMSSSGTVPTFGASFGWSYEINMDGFLFNNLNLKNTSGGTAGNGANTLFWNTPYVPTGTHYGVAMPYAINSTTGYTSTLLGTSSGYFILINMDTLSNLTCNDFNNAVREIRVVFSIEVF